MSIAFPNMAAWASTPKETQSSTCLEGQLKVRLMDASGFIELMSILNKQFRSSLISILHPIYPGNLSLSSTRYSEISVIPFSVDV